MLKGGKSTLKNNNRYSYEQKSLQYSNSGRAGYKTGTKPRQTPESGDMISSEQVEIAMM